jgi:hypothetical protein
VRTPRPIPSGTRGRRRAKGVVAVALHRMGGGGGGSRSASDGGGPCWSCSMVP